MALACGPPSHPPVAATTFGPPDRLATEYSTTATPGIESTNPIVLGLEKQLMEAARIRGWSLTVDGRLTELANWMGDQVLARVRPPGDAVDFAASRLGLTGPAPQIISVTYQEESALASRIADKLAQLPSNIAFRRYGRALLSDGTTSTAVIVVATTDVSLSAPVPRHVHVGDTLHLAGSLTPPFNSVRASITTPDGNVHESPSATATFDIPFATSGAGVHRVELLADGPDGPRVVANFPVYVDVPEPARFTSAASAGDSGSTSEIADLLFTKLNASRAAAQLPPLERFDPFVVIAKANSQDMVDHHFFSHISPTTGDVGDRVRRAGLELPSVGENIALGADADAMHGGLMASPAHRAAILSKEFTHVGIGVVYDSASSAYVGTEVFTRLPKTLDLATAPQKALDVINAGRSAPLTLDAGLTAAAQAGAEAYLKASGTQSEVHTVVAGVLQPRLNALGRHHAWAWQTLNVGDLADVSRADVSDTSISTIGIGVAQGPRGGISNAIIVCVIVESNK
jgi:uncharacterized protein YkwD